MPVTKHQIKIGVNEKVSPVVPTATEPTHAVNLGQADGRYGKKRTRKDISNTTQYTLVAADFTDYILYTTANGGESPNFILNEGVAPTGGSLQIIIDGDNTPVFTGGTGTTLNHPPGTELKGTGKHAWIGIIHSGSDVFDINGNLVGASGDFADTRLSNIVEDLTEAEKTTIKNKLGVIEGTGGSGEILYNVKNYEAKGDGKDVLDGNTTSGSNVFTSGIGPFQSSDVGKVLSIKGFTTTIAGYTDANTVTLSDNAPSTISGATWCYGTDDTVAIQSTIQASFNVGGGGVVYFPRSIYLINGALQTSVGEYAVNPNSQLWIPYYNADIQDRKTVELRGEVTATVYQALGIANRPAANSGAILRSTIQGSGINPSVIANKGGAPNDVLNMSRTNLMVKNLSVQVTANTDNRVTMGGFNCYDSSIANFEYVTCYPHTLDPQSTLEPNVINVTGIAMPKKASEHINTLRNVTVGGFTNGYKVGEHTSAYDVVAITCVNGFVPSGNNHSANLQKISAFWCKYAISPSAGTYIVVHNLAVECTNSGNWFDTVATINDPSNYLIGKLYFDIVEGGVGLNNEKFKKIGGAFLRCSPISIGPINNTVTDSTYTFKILDPKRVNEFNSSSPQTAIVPNLDTVSFDRGAKIKGFLSGAGGILFEKETGVTLITPYGGSIVNKYSTFELTNLSTNKWQLEIKEAPAFSGNSEYLLNETSGLVVNDSIGEADGANYGATQLGGTYSFDGVNDYLGFSALDGSVNGVDFSVECRVKFDFSNNIQRFLQNRGQGGWGAVPGFTMGFYSTTWGNTGLDNGAGESISFGDIAVAENDGAFHTYLLTWNTSLGRARFYIDGVLKSEKTNANLIDADFTGKGTVFGKSNQNAQWFKGEAATIRFYQEEVVPT